MSRFVYCPLQIVLLPQTHRPALSAVRKGTARLESHDEAKGDPISLTKIHRDVLGGDHPDRRRYATDVFGLDCTTGATKDGILKGGGGGSEDDEGNYDYDDNGYEVTTTCRRNQRWGRLLA